MNLKLTHHALSKLEASEAWQNSELRKFKVEEIYGPEGKLGWFWNLTWDDKNRMRSSLCTNMGGGVPISIIDVLVSICAAERAIL